MLQHAHESHEADSLGCLTGRGHTDVSSGEVNTHLIAVPVWWGGYLDVWPDM